MIITRVDQYFRTLNTSSEAMTMPMPVLTELFRFKKIFDEMFGYNFVLFTPEGSPPNSFGMTVGKENKPIILFNTPPVDPVSVFFYTPEQLGCSNETVNVLQEKWLKMLDGRSNPAVLKHDGDPWWFFLWR